MKEILQVVVFLVLAIPFIYMAYDVLKEIGRSLVKFLKTRGRLAWINIMSFIGE